MQYLKNKSEGKLAIEEFVVTIWDIYIYINFQKQKHNLYDKAYLYKTKNHSVKNMKLWN